MFITTGSSGDHTKSENYAFLLKAITLRCMQLYKYPKQEIKVFLKKIKQSLYSVQLHVVLYLTKYGLMILLLVSGPP